MKLFISQDLVHYLFSATVVVLMYWPAGPELKYCKEFWFRDINITSCFLITVLWLQIHMLKSIHVGIIYTIYLCKRCLNYSVLSGIYANYVLRSFKWYLHTRLKFKYYINYLNHEQTLIDLSSKYKGINCWRNVAHLWVPILFHQRFRVKANHKSYVLCNFAAFNAHIHVVMKPDQNFVRWAVFRNTL